jgi:hypothetical protein
LKGHKVRDFHLFSANLLIFFQWLEIFTRANQGDEKLQAILLRYDRFIAARLEKQRWKRIFLNEAVRLFRVVSKFPLTYMFSRNGSESFVTSQWSQATSVLPFTINLFHA